MKKKILFLINVDSFFLSHRLPIALEAIKNGYEVHLAAKNSNNENKLLISSYGINFHNLNIDRNGKAGVIKEFFEIYLIIKKIRPDILHLVTIKPVLLGGIVARLLDVPAVVSAISGLGIIFSADSLNSKLTKKIVFFLYYFALGHRNQKLIFQNEHDKIKLNNIKRDIYLKSQLIKGSGVDLSLYSVKKINFDLPIVMMASRLLLSKGVMEFVEASKIVKSINNNVRFVLVGDIDLSNPDSVKQSFIDQCNNDKFVEIWGYKNDMQVIISKACIFVLPSYYGEGLPKVLIEAAACGRAVITTDHPGCRDAVNSKSGILIPTRDSLSLATAIQELLQNPTKIEKMGKEARKLANETYSIQSVCDAHLKIYKNLILGNN